MNNEKRYGLTSLGEAYLWLKTNIDVKSIYQSDDPNTIICQLAEELKKHPDKLHLDLSDSDYKELAFQLNPVQPC